MASPGRGVGWGCGGWGGGEGFFLGGIHGKSCFHIQRFHSQFASPRDSYPIFLFKKNANCSVHFSPFGDSSYDIAKKLQVPITSVG